MQPELAPLRIGMALDGSSEAMERFVGLIRDEVGRLFESRRAVEFVMPPSQVGDWDGASAARAIQAALANETVDVVVAVGVLLAQQASLQSSLARPVILPLVTTHQLQFLPREGEASGGRHLNYLTGLLDAERDLRVFREITPIRRVAFLVDASFTEGLTGFQEYIDELGRRLGIGIDLVGVPPEVSGIVDRLPNGIDAVYLGAIPQLARKQLRPLCEALNARRLPTFAALGPEWVRAGALASIMAADEWRQRARRVALHIERIVQGEAAETLPVVFESQEDLTLNMATARRIGVSPRFSVIVEAHTINAGQDDSHRALGLREVLQEAAARNLDVDAATARLGVERARADAARSALFPRINAGLRGQLVDEDLASNFGASQRMLTWTADGSQLLYDPYSWAALRGGRLQQRAQEDALARTRADAMFAAARSYFDVLRARTQAEIQRRNLELTRSNLAIAETRRTVGVADPGEVYRWQIELANSRRSVIEALAVTRQAEVLLNQNLNRPLEERVAPRESPQTALAKFGKQHYQPFLENQRSFRLFRDFMVLEGLARAPELRQVRHRLQAVRRNLKGDRRGIWLPTLSLDANLTHNFLRDGIGEGTPVAPSGSGVVFPDPTEPNWTAGISATLPLFAGTERYARIDEKQAQIRELSANEKATVLEVSSAIRRALFRASSSLPGVSLAQAGAKAAHQNLEVVRDGYSQGTVNIINLLDAQNQALTAQLDATDAVFDYLTDVMDIQRSTNTFIIDISDAENAEMLRRLRGFAGKPE